MRVLQIYFVDVTGIAVKADRGRSGKTTSGNGQAWSSSGIRQVSEGSEEQEKMEETVAKSSV